jgi:prepilin-type N-terminal cleavage/methylation domain-containing protein
VERSCASRGFTLVELIVVLVVVGIIVTIAVPKMISIADETQAASCRYLRENVKSACATYYASTATEGNPHYPDDWRDLYKEGDVPVCPGGGTWTYDADKGRVSCSLHPE